jgi:cell division protein FtsL
VNLPAQPVVQLFAWLLSPRVLLALLAGVSVVATALADSYYAHRMRAAFAQEQALAKARDALLVEQGRLLLERSALSALARVEQLAASDLGMRLPQPGDMRLVDFAGTQVAAATDVAAATYAAGATRPGGASRVASPTPVPAP